MTRFQRHMMRWPHLLHSTMRTHLTQIDPTSQPTDRNTRTHIVRMSVFHRYPITSCHWKSILQIQLLIFGFVYCLCVKMCFSFGLISVVHFWCHCLRLSHISSHFMLYYALSPHSLTPTPTPYLALSFSCAISSSSSSSLSS